MLPPPPPSRIAAVAVQRAATSLTTFPDGVVGWAQILGVTALATVAAGAVAEAAGFMNLEDDYDPPWSQRGSYEPWILKPLSAFAFPALPEELFWRGVLLPSPAKAASIGAVLPIAVAVLAVHVAFHPLAAVTVWPRGRQVFCDTRFLLLAAIVLGGATASYLVSGGSVYAAAFAHAVPVALWRDFFGGEARMSSSSSGGASSSPSPSSPSPAFAAGEDDRRHYETPPDVK